jgi:hypothetical protein
MTEPNIPLGSGSIGDYIVQGGTATFVHLGTREAFTLDELRARFSDEQIRCIPLGVLRPEGRRRWCRPSAPGPMIDQRIMS